MRNKMTAAEAIRANIEESALYSVVEVLAFKEIEFPTSHGRYHAIGVYRANGVLRVRMQSGDFASRLPANAKDLYLNTLYTVEDERANARSIASRWTLPPVLASLIDQAGAGPDPDLKGEA